MLTHRSAAPVTLGPQTKPGYGATIKHMACNNQEDGRGCIQASNNLLMSGNPNDVATIIQAVNEGTLSKAQLQWCSVNMLRMPLYSHAFEA